MLRKKWKRLCRSVRNYVARNCALIVAGYIAQFVLTLVAHERRGHFAVGGEVLVLPLILILWEIIRLILSSVIYVMEYE